MVTFYPRDIERWRSTDLFDFTCRPDVSLSMNPKSDSITFYTRAELIQFLKDHGGVNLTEGRTLHFTGPYDHHVLGKVYDVTHWILLGWMKDDFR